MAPASKRVDARKSAKQRSGDGKSSVSLTVKAPLMEGMVHTGRTQQKHDFLRETFSMRASNAIVVNATVKPGDILADFPIAPAAFEGTRFGLLSGMYARWRANKIRVWYPGGPAATHAGRYLMAWLPDVSTKLASTGNGKINQLFGVDGNVNAPVWVPRTVDIRGMGLRPMTPWALWLYTNPSEEVVLREPYWGSVGRVVLIADGDWSSVAGTTEISVNIDIEAEFTEPTLRLNEVESSPAIDVELGDLAGQAVFRLDNDGALGAAMGISPDLQTEVARVLLELTSSGSPDEVVPGRLYAADPSSTTPANAAGAAGHFVSRTNDTQGVIYHQTIEQHGIHGNSTPFSFPGPSLRYYQITPTAGF